MSTAQIKLLSTLRNTQYTHLVPDLPLDLFTDTNKSLFEAYKITLQRYGAISAEGVESVYGELPPEFDIPVAVDPMPLISDLTREYHKRKLKELAQELLTETKAFEPNIKGIKDRFDIFNGFVPHDTSLNTGIARFTAGLRAKESGVYQWLRTGVPFLDKMIGGEYPRGEVTIITARSGGGKTALMGSSALNIGLMALEGHANLPTIFSMEMPKDQLVARFLADMTGIDSRAIRLGGHVSGVPFSVEEKELLSEAIIKLQRIPMAVVDAERLSADQIISIARSLHVEKGSEIFFIDYLQLMSYDLELGKHYGLGNGVKQLKEFAKKYNVAFVILAQYHEQKETIRDSTDPEKDAALWLHLNIDFDTRDEHGICTATIEIWKNRHGPIGNQTVLYDSRRLAFVGNTNE